MQPSCPNVNELKRFLLGQLDPQADKALGEHVEGCAVCMGTVQHLLREITPRPGMPKADHGRSTEVPTKVPDCSFLAPPEEPGELGRLGDYRVLRLIGSGGMGLVFLAEDIRLKRSVALKTMSPDLYQKAHFRQRFLREAQAMAAIHHDNIVPIFQVGEDRNMPFIAMPLLEGETLAQKLDRAAAFSLAEILTIGRQVAAGLAVAHAQGLIHRDIKPGNIWLEPPSRATPVKSAGGTEAAANRVKILDFGLARIVEGSSELTSVSMLVGTPAFMSPEQARAQPTDRRSDLFSLGSVLYRLTTGELPFSGSSVINTLIAVTSHDPKPAHTLNPQVPKRLGDLIMRLLAKDPSQRPQSAQEVAKELDAIANEEHTALLGTPLAMAGRNKLNRLGLWRIAIASILLLGAVGMSYWFGPAIWRYATNQHSSNPGEGYEQPRTKPEDTYPDTVVAKWVLSVGSIVRIVKDGRTMELDRFQKLPDEPFKVTGIHSHSSQKISDEDLERFRKLSKLYSLSLAGAPITNKGLSHITGINPLRSIDLSNTAITDEAIEQLMPMSSRLRLLVLQGTKVSDVGLARLEAFKQLRTLDVRDTAVTAQGIAKLRMALPECKVKSDFGAK